MRGPLLHKRRKTPQSLRIHCCMSDFQRGTSLLAFMHNHTSECLHRHNSYRESKLICNCNFFFSVTDFCRLSSAWHFRETRTPFFFWCFFFLPALCHAGLECCLLCVIKRTLGSEGWPPHGSCSCGPL